MEIFPQPGSDLRSDLKGFLLVDTNCCLSVARVRPAKFPEPGSQFRYMRSTMGICVLRFGICVLPWVYAFYALVYAFYALVYAFCALVHAFYALVFAFYALVCGGVWWCVLFRVPCGGGDDDDDVQLGRVCCFVFRSISNMCALLL